MRSTRRRPSPFANARRAESEYARRLRAIARIIDEIIRAHGVEDPEAVRQIEEALLRYSELITPWARAVGRRMLAEVARRDATAWLRHGRLIGRTLREEIATAPTGAALNRLLDEQIDLITSLPREAAERVHALAREGLSLGTRWTEVAKDIMTTGEVTRSRANTIARTETGRAASTLTAVRAQYVGSPGFFWRTARDADVRLLHRTFEGRFYAWDNPPILDDGRPGLPGTIWNCRCFSEPVIGDVPEPGTVNRRARNPAYLAALREAGYTTGAAFEE